MTKKTIAPYGSWKSPITTDLVTANAIRIEEIICDRDSIYWLEFRANQSGRQVIVRQSPDGNITDITPPEFNIRSRVHEYGGASYQVFNGVVYFSNFEDQRLYSQVPGKEPRALTPKSHDRYADFAMDDQHQHLICIREQHAESEQEVINSLVAIPLDGTSPVEVLVSGNDFYSDPRISPDGKLLCWLTWNHPNMPWDGCELWIGSFDDTGNISHAQCIAGGQNESIFQPEWSPEGDLFFISDRSGWWTPYRVKDERIISVCDLEAEFGLPQWVFGLSTYAFSGSDQLICTYSRSGQNHLANLDILSGELTNIPTPYVEYSSLCVNNGKILFVGGSTDRPAELVSFDLELGTLKVLRQTGSNLVDKGFISFPQMIEFSSQKNLSAYGNFYPPTNSNHSSPPR